MAPRKGWPKREIGARVLGTWRNRHPGSVPIPAEFLRFHSSSSAIPTRFFRIKSDSQSNGHPNSHPRGQRWNYLAEIQSGGAMELERKFWGSGIEREELGGGESGQNQVPVSPCSMDRRAKINFASGPP